METRDIESPETEEVIEDGESAKGATLLRVLLPVKKSNY
jgi:hypothetical protein